MRLNEIRDKHGAHKGRMRVGRGHSSGKGKTSGKGVKGQKARTGVSLLGFEGGQMPLYRRLPKRGFHNPFRKTYAIVNLGTLQEAVDAGRLDAAKPVNAESLRAAGLISGKFDGIRVLAMGELKAKLTIEAEGASKAAQSAVEQAGGKMTLLAPPAKEPRERGGKRAKAKGPEAGGSPAEG